MSLHVQDIALARLWTEQNVGEDDPLDVFEWKLIELVRDVYARRTDFHA